MLCTRIHKRLKTVDINVSFTCRTDQIMAIVGSSGAGKTTILRTVAGLEQPDEGFVSFNSTPWFDSRKSINIAPQKRRVGYVSQGYRLFPHLNVEQNVAFAARSPEKVSQLIDLLGITAVAQSRPGQISGGERQRVAFAQALATEPGIMLLDEPFSALDFRTKEKLRQQLIDMKEMLNIPILVVTHDLEDAIRLADRILPIMNGRFAPEWMPDTLRFTAPEPCIDNTEIKSANNDIPVLSIPAGCQA